MKTTEKVNIGGFSFTIEQDAYETIEKYLSDISQAYSSDPFAKEIMSDIEVRIAELLLERCGKDKVANKTDVLEVTGRIGSPRDIAMEEDTETKQGRSKGEKFADNPKRLYRDIDNRMLGGICSGIAATINLDTVFVRLAFVMLFLLGFLSNGSFFGIMTLLYVILWIIVPPAKTVEEKCKMRGKPIELEQFKMSVKEFGSEAVSSPGLHAFGKVMATIIGIIMTIIGASGLLGSTMLTAMPKVILRFAERPEWFQDGSIQNYMYCLMTGQTIWWIITAIAGLFSVLMLYNGILLTFNLKAPKWKPGIVLFIMWILSILVLAGFIVNRLADFSLTV